MKGKPIKAHWFLWVIIAASIMAGIVLYSKFPEQMPLHWNATGEVDRYGSRLEGLFLIPLMNAGLLLLMIWLPAIDPRRKNYEKFEKFYKILQWSIVVFMTFMQALVMFWSLGYQISIPFFVKLGLGILFILLGNYMGKVKSNWFVGIRNPWTLENEEIWVKTHRMAGPLMMGAGIISLLMAFIDNGATFWIVIISVIVATSAPTVYSFLLYRKLAG